MSNKTFYFCASHGQNPHILIFPLMPFLLLLKDRNPVFPFTVTVWPLHCWTRSVFTRILSNFFLHVAGVSVIACLLLNSKIKLMGFLGGPFLADVFPLNFCTWASRLKVCMPSYFLKFSCWSYRKNQRVHAARVWDSFFLSPGLFSVILTTKTLFQEKRKERTFFQHFRARKMPFPWKVYINLGNICC